MPGKYCIKCKYFVPDKFNYCPRCGYSTRRGGGYDPGRRYSFVDHIRRLLGLY
jgi:hypothetical protein